MKRNVLIQLGAAYRSLGRNPDGLTANKQALAACVRAADQPCEAEARYRLGTFHFWMGAYPDAFEPGPNNRSRSGSRSAMSGNRASCCLRWAGSTGLSGESDKAWGPVTAPLIICLLSAAAGDKRDLKGERQEFLGTGVLLPW